MLSALFSSFAGSPRKKDTLQDANEEDTEAESQGITAFSTATFALLRTAHVVTFLTPFVDNTPTHNQIVENKSDIYDTNREQVSYVRQEIEHAVIDAEESYEHTLSKVENILGQFHQQVS
jgi:hypothetical protein